MNLSTFTPLLLILFAFLGPAVSAALKDIEGANGLMVQIEWPDDRRDLFWKSVKEW